MSTFGIHVPKLIPVQVLGGAQGISEDTLIGDFEGGVVLRGMDLMAIKSSTVIASFSVRQRKWVVRDTPYQYLFMQVQPID